MLFIACMAGSYLSMTYGECRDCPENSVGVEPGLVVCPCVEGYYRAPGEEDLPCTRELLIPYKMNVWGIDYILDA